LAFESLSGKLEQIFKGLRGRGKVSEADVKACMREVRLALLDADVNFKVAKEFIANVTQKATGSQVLESLTPAQQIIKIVNEELAELMGRQVHQVKFSSRPPTIIMMCGLQGSGKTTHSAKLAKMFKAQGKRPIMAACDIYRPAAIEQLKTLGTQIDVPVFEMGTENPVTIAKKALAHAKDYGYDPLILDTAGRLHIDEELMNELKSIKTEVNPNEIIFVVDSMTGQDAVTAAEAFDKALGISGIILTKLDGDTRGGAALSVKAVTGKPIMYVGTGEKTDAIEPFYPDRMAARILGMGDVLTLIEKARENVDEKEEAKLAEKLRKNSFTLDDLLEQMRQVRKMGSFAQLVNMLPGGSKVSDEETRQAEAQLKLTESIICSMTAKERRKPEIINPSRKRRIAAGSGTRVEDVNRLLKQHKQMRDLFKKMTGGKRRKGLNFGF
jgi:signal recognition particle subunit SRP54